MPPTFGERIRAMFAPPRYLAPPLAGIDLSTSGVKAVLLVEDMKGLILSKYSEARLPSGAFVDGEVVDHAVIVEALSTAARAIGVGTANAALPESKSFIFETSASGSNNSEWRTAVEQRLEELIPLSPQETDFDLIEVGRGDRGDALLTGVGFARRIVDDTLSVFDNANISVQALEEETFAIARALLPRGDQSTTLIIDIGKTTTKISIVAKRIPRFSTTIGIGGHALTLAVQKYFGVTETEARRVKSERGIVPAQGNEEYLAAMLSTVSAIRDEIARRLEYWQGTVTQNSAHEPVSAAVLCGGNASIRGLPEYLEGALQIPVRVGDAFNNLASRDAWIPQLDHTESLAYATAIGLALYDHAQNYAS